MIRPLALMLVVLSPISALGAPAATQPLTQNWPQFRGPDGDGHAVAPDLPLSWSEIENVVWKTPIHDAGWSSPVIWGKQVWVTTARVNGKELFAVCIDRETGRIVHDIKVFDVEKPEFINPANTYASPTPLIEAGRLFVNYGTYGTACIDTETGKILWSRQDIHCDHEMGPGSSLADAGKLLVFNMDGRDQQYVIALDKATGKTAWKTDRSFDYSKVIPNFRKAYSTPALAEVAGQAQLVSTGGQGCIGYDPATGKELWKVRFNGWSATVRPVCGEGMAFIGTDCDRPQLWGIRLDGHGDVTDSHVAWRIAKNMPATPSPLLVDGLLYVVSDNGLASCIDAKTGAIAWEQKLGGIYGASPLYAAGRIYFLNRAGTATVLAPGREARPAPVAPSKLEGTFMASPAVADNTLFIRSKTHLYRIGTAVKP